MNDRRRASRRCNGRAFGEMTWLGMIALAILLIHVVAAASVLPASRGPAALLEDAKASLTD